MLKRYSSRAKPTYCFEPKYKTGSYVIDLGLHDTEVIVIDSNLVLNTPSSMNELINNLSNEDVGKMIMYSGPTTSQYEYKSMYLVDKDGDSGEIKLVRYDNPDIVTVNGGQI